MIPLTSVNMPIDPIDCVVNMPIVSPSWPSDQPLTMFTISRSQNLLPISLSTTTTRFHSCTIVLLARAAFFLYNHISSSCSVIFHTSRIVTSTSGSGTQSI